MSEHREQLDAPETVKLLQYIYRHVHQETDIVRRAPLAVLIIFLVGAAITYTVQSARYSDLVSTLEARHKYLSEQLDDYKKAFPGKSPDEAARELSRLQERVDKLNKRVSDQYVDRHLTDADRTMLQREISPLREELKLEVGSASDAEAIQYAKEFIVEFKSIGLKLVPTPYDLPIPMTFDNTTKRGLLIGIGDPENPSEAATKLFAALWRAGFVAPFEKTNGLVGKQIILIVGPKPRLE